MFSWLKYFWAPKNCGKEMEEVNDNNLKDFYKSSKINLWRFHKNPNIRLFIRDSESKGQQNINNELKTNLNELVSI